MVVMLVPILGPLRLVNAEKEAIATLLAESDDGRYVDFGVKNGDEEIGRVAFLVIEGPSSINMRARYILASLTGVHMVVTGLAAFYGLPDQRFAQIVAEYT